MEGVFREEGALVELTPAWWYAIASSIQEWVYPENNVQRSSCTHLRNITPRGPGRWETKKVCDRNQGGIAMKAHAAVVVVAIAGGVSFASAFVASFAGASLARSVWLENPYCVVRLA